MEKNSQWLTVNLDGGLDFMSSKTTVNPGSMIDCLNYEVAIRRGYSLFEGYERYDGGTSPTFASNVVPTFQGLIAVAGAASFGVGADIVVRNTLGGTSLAQVITSSATGTGANRLVTVQVTLLSSLDGPLSVALDLNTQTYSLAYQGDLALTGTVQDAYSARFQIYDPIFTTIQAVPGQGPVLGLFWYKDFLYAARDYFSASFDTGLNKPTLGDELFQGALYALASWKGYVARFGPVTGDFDGGGNAAGTMSFYNTTGTMSAGLAIRNHTRADATVGSITAVGVDAIGAGLYKASGGRGTTFSTASWQHQDLGWNVGFNTGGTAQFQPLNTALQNADITTQIQTTDWKVPTADDPNIGNNAWTTEPVTGPASYWPQLDDGATPDYDGTYAWQGATTVVGGFKNTVRVKGFNFTASDIPTGAYITGIEVQVVKKAYRSGFAAITVVDDKMHVLGLGTDLSQGFGDAVTPWTVTNVKPDNTPGNWNTVVYGGKQSLLGATNVTTDKIFASDFGVQLGAKLVAVTGAGGAEAHITSVRIRVSYLPPSSKIYFWNGTTAVTANVVQAYVQSGLYSASTAAGQLYLSSVASTRAIQGGEQIRTYPANPALPPDGGAADGSTLIAKTSTYAEKNVMDWGALLTDVSTIDKPIVSKYQHIVYNFFASAGLDALFMVSGGGPCAYYDGTNFSRILTGLSITAEKPRHVEAFQGRLWLAYYSGNLTASDGTSPLSYDGALGAGTAAFSLGFGAPITGLAEFNGSTLAVYTANSVKMVQGNVNDPNGIPDQGTISPKIGSIEYCSASMGQFLFVSFRGIASIESVQDYGSFKETPISAAVWDWLRPRLQTSAFFEVANKRIVGVLPVKNKGQIRLLFADGYILTATFLNVGEIPQFTIQKYTDSDTLDTTMTIVCAGTESLGRDRIFASNDNTDGFVYELDRGTTFDEAEYTAFFTLNTNDLRIPYQSKAWKTMHVHGLMVDYAAFNVYRSKNYDSVASSSTAIPYQGGALTSTYTGLVTPFMSKGTSELAREGRNINLKFSHNVTFGEDPHVLQALSIQFTPLKEESN